MHLTSDLNQLRLDWQIERLAHPICDELARFPVWRVVITVAAVLAFVLTVFIVGWLALQGITDRTGQGLILGAEVLAALGGLWYGVASCRRDYRAYQKARERYNRRRLAALLKHGDR
jgi:hypothetical protein